MAHECACVQSAAALVLSSSAHACLSCLPVVLIVLVQISAMPLTQTCLLVGRVPWSDPLGAINLVQCAAE